MGATHRQQSEASARRGACHGRLADRSLTGRLRPSGPIENRTLTCVTSQYASGCWWGVAFDSVDALAWSSGFIEGKFGRAWCDSRSPI